MAGKSASVPMMTFAASLVLAGITLAYGLLHYGAGSWPDPLRALGAIMGFIAILSLIAALVCESKATKSLLALRRKRGHG